MTFVAWAQSVEAGLPNEHRPTIADVSAFESGLHLPTRR